MAPPKRTTGSTKIAKVARPVPSESTDDNGSALARGIQVLRVFRIGDSALSNGELARRTGLPKPTISRITAKLTQLGCLNFIHHLNGYKLGGGTVAIGQVAAENFDLLQLARPHLRKLADEAGLTVAIGMRDNDRMVCMQVYEAPAIISLRLRVGLRLPLFSSAMGRAYLAALPADSCAELIKKYGSSDPEERERQERTIGQAKAELDKFGYCTVTGEWYPDVNGIAVPIEATEGVYVLDCGGPAFAFPQKRMVDEIGPQLAHTVRIIEEMGVPFSKAI